MRATPARVRRPDRRGHPERPRGVQALSRTQRPPVRRRGPRGVISCPAGTAVHDLARRSFGGVAVPGAGPQAHPPGVAGARRRRTQRPGGVVDLGVGARRIGVRRDEPVAQTAGRSPAEGPGDDGPGEPGVGEGGLVGGVRTALGAAEEGGAALRGGGPRRPGRRQVARPHDPPGGDLRQVPDAGHLLDEGDDRRGRGGPPRRSNVPRCAPASRPLHAQGMRPGGVGPCRLLGVGHGRPRPGCPGGRRPTRRRPRGSRR